MLDQGVVFGGIEGHGLLPEAQAELLAFLGGDPSGLNRFPIGNHLVAHIGQRDLGYFSFGTVFRRLSLGLVSGLVGGEIGFQLGFRRLSDFIQVGLALEHQRGHGDSFRDFVPGGVLIEELEQGLIAGLDFRIKGRVVEAGQGQVNLCQTVDIFPFQLEGQGIIGAGKGIADLLDAVILAQHSGNRLTIVAVAGLQGVHHSGVGLG